MKKNIVAVGILLAFVTTAKAQTSFFAETQSYMSQKNYSPFEFIWANKYFDSSKWGVFLFASATNTWGELYLGPNFTFKSKSKPQNFLEIGAGFGIETDPLPYRGACYAFFNLQPNALKNKGKVQGLLNAEYGGSGYWYLGFITKNITEKVAIGIHAQAFTGVWGLRFQYQPGYFMFYVVPGYSLERNEFGAVVALRCYF